MPKFIPNRHIKRMFPYAFYDELYNVMPELIPENPVFLLRDTEHESKLDDDIIKQFNEFRHAILNNKTLEENNIYTLDQGEFLILDTYIRKSDRQKAIDKQHVAKFIIMVQLYDSSEQPVFSESVSIKSIRQIPEILWDDPNLAIVAMQVLPDDEDSMEMPSEIGIFKAPPFIIEKYIQPEPASENNQSIGGESN